jgi:phage tail-like protein
LTDWTDPDGIRLLLVGSVPDQKVIDAPTLLGLLPPHRLARGCGPGFWLLLDRDGNVLRRDPCTGRWHSLWRGRLPEGLQDARALAASPDRVAVVDAEGVRVWTAFGETQVAAIRLEDARRVAFFPGGDLLVACQAAGAPILLHRFGPAGHPLGRMPFSAATDEPIDRLAVSGGQASTAAAAGGGDGTSDPSSQGQAVTLTVGPSIWITTGEDKSARQLWRGSWQRQFEAATAADLANYFPPTGLTRADEHGFCLEETGPDGVPATSCTSWEGKPIAEACVPPPSPPQYQQSGLITSGWIDSGIPRCRWHRIRVDADVPKGTGIDISYVATDFDPSDPCTWEEPAHSLDGRGPDDYQLGPPGALDLLCQFTTGRFFKLKLQFNSDGQDTPVVWSVRIDFPRRTSLDRLPAVYRLTPEAEDFTERFLANFDASIEDLDAAVARFPALFDACAVPGEVLPWLGSFLDVVFDPDWTESRRRRVLRELPALYPMRGTIGGLTAVCRLIFDVEPAVRELAVDRSWGALADSASRETEPPRVQPEARVGSVRLFGKARARYLLGHSALGAAPLRGYGNPDLDPLAADAYRFEVQIPRSSPDLDPARVAALVESQKPAHTAAAVRFGGDGFVVGVWSAVGIDTAFTPLPRPVLGAAGNVRLRRASLVAAGPPRGRLPLVVNVSSAVGVQTLLE